MPPKMHNGDQAAAVREILGYLNFSSGASDPRFLHNLNQLFANIAAEKPPQPVWQTVGQTLRDELEAVRGTTDAFRRVEQVEAVRGLVFDALLPAYRQFHRDLLFHQTEESLFQPFFIGRACEAVLRQGPPWSRPTGSSPTPCTS